MTVKPIALSDAELASLRNAALTLGGVRWTWWTSNSFRRLTFDGPGNQDGGALTGTVHPYDRHPDVSMAPGVQHFIECASPAAALAMVDMVRDLQQQQEEARLILSAIFNELDDGPDAPGHAHNRPGIWDSGNGNLSGQPCEWCATWTRAADLLKEIP